MKSIRIIPRLDIKGPNLVKGIHLEGLRVLGKPEDFAYQYYLDGADELIYIDVVASLYGRDSLLDIIRKTAERIFIPLTVGGGIRTIDDIRDILRAGADKVAINTAAIHNPHLIREGAKTFGSQCIVVSIEAKQKDIGIYEAYTDNGRERTGLDVFKWAAKACGLGAGEILITSIDKEGTGKGYDIELAKRVAESVSIPVIACGGAGGIEDFHEIVKEAMVDAVSASSVFHYNHLKEMSEASSFIDEGNIEYLKHRTDTDIFGIGRIKPLSIIQLKDLFSERGITCRTSWNANRDAISMRPEPCKKPSVVIIEYGLGNLFSIERALKYIGASVEITDDQEKILKAERLILPGVGAFGDGMAGLKKRGLIKPIKEYIKSGKPLLGICLGMQLLMSEGEEFGVHKGIDIIQGRAVRLKEPQDRRSSYKIPHIGWNELLFSRWHKNDASLDDGERPPWEGTILEDLKEGASMYFVHSNVAIPENQRYSLAETEYGENIFCSVLKKENVYGCQFHPERSGEEGLKIYRQFIFGIQNAFVKEIEQTSL